MIGLYRKPLEEVGRDRHIPVLDPWTPVPASKIPLTDNGLHLTEYGYWVTGPGFCRLFADAKPQAAIDEAAPAQSVSWRRKIQDTTLPFPAAPTTPAGRTVRITGLRAGNYLLTIDGRPAAKTTAAAWAVGIALPPGPEWEQVEELRRAIVAKNASYFYRYRPQNETYLFGFRKHEQGQNAKEVPEFDPLVAKAEERIDQLRQPRPHDYELRMVP